MQEMQVKSKVCVQSKPKKVLKVIVSICVVIISLLGLISILNDGLKIENISPVIMAIVIGIGVYRNSKESSFYRFDIAAITIGEKLTIHYKDSNFQIVFEIHDIFSLQYSDQLKCLKIIGNYEKIDNKNRETFINNEYLLYVGDGEEVEIIKELEIITNLQVQYMDR